MTHDPPPEPRPLDYHPVEPDSEERGDTSIFALKTFIAFVLSAGLVVAAVFAVFMLRMSVGPSPGLGLVLSVYLAVALALAAAAIALRKRPRFRGYAEGIWLGLGFATLLQGICFLRL